MGIRFGVERTGELATHWIAVLRAFAAFRGSEQLLHTTDLDGVAASYMTDRREPGHCCIVRQDASPARPYIWRFAG
jgi:hypothetical protein